jgi:hypothetical protein
LLKANQYLSTMFSVKKPAATDQIVSGTPDASSKINSMPSWLWTPA